MAEEKFPHPCEYHPDQVVTGLELDPYDQEINDKETLVPNCPLCLQQSAEEI